jgi:tetratricopeptide (TPR) repeat protein
MPEPTTAEEVLALHKIQKADPTRYLEIVNGWLDENPNSPTALFSRHQAWMSVGEPRKALEDLNRSIELEPDRMSFWARGDVHRHLGDYESAIEDYAQGEAMDPERWQADVLPLLHQADAYARHGDQAMAMTYWARLPEDFWTPGHNQLPPGGKSEIAHELRRRAERARRQQQS